MTGRTAHGRRPATRLTPIPTGASLWSRSGPRADGGIRPGGRGVPSPRGVMLLPHVRLSPVFGTRDEKGNSAVTMCTETQSTNERRVGGWPESLWTVCRRDHLAAVMGGAL